MKIFSNIANLCLPYLVMYIVYIQLNGEVSPGGGFQAGCIAAVTLICYQLIRGIDDLEELLSFENILLLGISGFFIYFLVGILSIIFNNNFLNYEYLVLGNLNPHQLGIMIIEIGVGITVFSALIGIYILFSRK